MLDFSVDRSIEILSRTPEVLRAQLSGLPDEWLHANEGDNTWSPFQITGHLIHGELEDWIARTKIILNEGESRPFEPFIRDGFKIIIPDKMINELLDQFKNLRAGNIRIIKGIRLDDDMLNRTGTHPAFGVVTLRQLLSTWAVHDLGHIAQISRVLAKQYSAEVGPWREYLPIVG